MIQYPGHSSNQNKSRVNAKLEERSRGVLSAGAELGRPSSSAARDKTFSNVLANIFANGIQARVFWEEGTSNEKMLPSNWSVSKSVGAGS